MRAASAIGDRRAHANRNGLPASEPGTTRRRRSWLYPFGGSGPGPSGLGGKADSGEPPSARHVCGAAVWVSPQRSGQPAEVAFGAVPRLHVGTQQGLRGDPTCFADGVRRNSTTSSSALRGLRLQDNHGAEVRKRCSRDVLLAGGGHYERLASGPEALRQVHECVRFESCGTDHDDVGALIG